MSYESSITCFAGQQLVTDDTWIQVSHIGEILEEDFSIDFASLNTEPKFSNESYYWKEALEQEVSPSKTSRENCKLTAAVAPETHSLLQAHECFVEYLLHSCK